MQTMKWLLAILTFFFLGFSNPIFSQDIKTYFEANELNPKSTDDGIFYLIEAEGAGEKVKVDDYVKIKYRGILLDGTEFDVSAEEFPFVFRVGHRQVIKGWDLGLQEFQVGSKGKLFVPSKFGYGKNGIADVIPPNTDLIYEVELLEIMNSKQYNQYMKELEVKERQRFEEKKQEQFVTDKKIIQNYAVKNKLRTKRLPSGVSYVLTKRGKGSTAKSGDFIEVKYKGQLTDGTIFDDSFGKKSESFKFVLGKGKAIEGWEEGLKKFKKGSEGWLLIPSALAYGPRSIREGVINIPANSVLVFKIKVVDLRMK
jgi:FKBP-type peptidyl-prolyl cis-trans isomerase